MYTVYVHRTCARESLSVCQKYGGRVQQRERETGYDPKTSVNKCSINTQYMCMCIYTFTIYIMHVQHILYLCIQHEYVARPELCSQLMLSLIKVLEAPHPKTSKHSVTEDMDDDKDDEEVRSSNVSVTGREGNGNMRVTKGEGRGEGGEGRGGMKYSVCSGNVSVTREEEGGGREVRGGEG